MCENSFLSHENYFSFFNINHNRKLIFKKDWEHIKVLLNYWNVPNLMYTFIIFKLSLVLINAYFIYYNCYLSPKRFICYITVTTSIGIVYHSSKFTERSLVSTEVAVVIEVNCSARVTISTTTSIGSTCTVIYSLSCQSQQ